MDASAKTRQYLRDTHYGHQIFFTTGRSGLILDGAIPTVNPADSTWTVPLLRRQRAVFGRAPRQAIFDGAFTSTGNLTGCKALGVSDVCFAKKRGLAVLAMVRSQRVYDTLRRFRAGMGAGIPLLQRVSGLARCVWKGVAGFHADVRTAVLAAILLTRAPVSRKPLAAHSLARQPARRHVDISRPLATSAHLNHFEG